MDKFDNISGFVGNNDYNECQIHNINADSFTNKDIEVLEKKGYNKHFGYKKGGCWHNALINGDKIDPKERSKKELEGYILEKVMTKCTSKPISECQWIDNVIGNGMKELVIKFQYDRFSTLDYQEKKLKKDTFITYKDVLDFVDEFYNKDLTKSELNKIRKTDDCFDYWKKAEEAYKNNTKLKRKEVMGDCVYFEGFESNGYETYTLRLGS